MWGALADFYHFPHVQVFESTAGLTERLLTEDLKALSRGQLAAAWRLFRRSRLRFAHALAQATSSLYKGKACIE